MNLPISSAMNKDVYALIFSFLSSNSDKVSVMKACRFFRAIGKEKFYFDPIFPEPKKRFETAAVRFSNELEATFESFANQNQHEASFQKFVMTDLDLFFARHPNFEDDRLYVSSEFLRANSALEIERLYYPLEDMIELISLLRTGRFIEDSQSSSA